MSEVSLKELEDLLEAERRDLLTGDLDAVARLSLRKAKLNLQLDRDDSETDLRRLEQKLKRNGDLLAAAGEGLKAGVARLRALATPPPLTTYDGNGQRQSLQPAIGEVTRRA